MRMRLDQPGDVAEKLDAFALPSCGIAPCRNLAFQRVLQRGDAEQDAMHVRSNGPARKVAVEILRAELKADFRLSLEVDGPLEFLSPETGPGENLRGPFDGLGGDDKINILSHHRLRRPMIHRDPADGAPRNIRPLQAIHRPERSSNGNGTRTTLNRIAERFPVLHGVNVLGRIGEERKGVAGSRRTKPGFLGVGLGF